MKKLKSVALVGQEKQQVVLLINAAMAAQQAFVAVVNHIATREGLSPQKYQFNQMTLKFEPVSEG